MLSRVDGEQRRWQQKRVIARGRFSAGSSASEPLPLTPTAHSPLASGICGGEAAPANTGSGSVSLNGHCLNVFTNLNSHLCLFDVVTAATASATGTAAALEPRGALVGWVPQIPTDNERGTPRPAPLTGLSPDLLHLLCHLHPLLCNREGEATGE